MPLRWKIFKVICIIQLMAAAFNELDILFSFFRGASWGGLIGLFVFLAVLLLCILGLNLLSQNYPDEPVEGRQKKNYNRLFLINFLFLAALFGYVIAEFRSLSQLASLGSRHLLQLPFSVYLMMIMHLAMLFMQLYILYGLYRLRIELHENFMRRKFEFEQG